MLNLLVHSGRILNSVSTFVGRSVPWLMVPFVLITFITVGLRYLFNYGDIGLQEVSTYLHAIILMLCMGYTLQCNEHVRIDIFYNKMTVRGKAIVNLIGSLIFLLPTSLTILLISIDYAVRSWLLLESSLEAGGLPIVFVLKSLIPIMALLLLIQGGADIALNIKRIAQK